MFLEKINSPEDVKNIAKEKLDLLCKEIRTTLLERLSKAGGHVGPNLGVVELTVAMHYVFNSPKDKIVFDVSHQSYTHKILTGRKAAFMDEAKYHTVSGYSNPDESEHDFFKIGHTSTSISLAGGLAKARDLKGETDNIIAVIGDGSLSGGEAYEGLNNAVEVGTNMIVIVNDNEMSIAENYGGLYRNLAELRATNGAAENNFFKSLGFEYYYVAAGNDVQKLIEVLTQVKDTMTPVVVHIHTEKGNGYLPALENKEAWHAGGPFDLETGEKAGGIVSENYSEISAQFLLESMQEDERVVAITSGTPGVIAFNETRRKMAGKQFVDVGIAEEHAVAFASGIAKNGGKPVYPVFSTFLSRTYDQLAQDLCINNNPATLLVFWASIYGMRDVTHLGIFDIAMMSNIPNLVYLAPTSKEEYLAMLAWSMEQTKHPVAIRVPGGEVRTTGIADTTNYAEINKYQMTQKGTDVAIIGLGNFYTLAEEVSEALQKDLGMTATLINPKFITGVDEVLLETLKAEHQLVITLEDGVLDGGFGEKITRYFGTSKMKVQNYGIKKSFPDRYEIETLLQENRLTTAQILADIKQIILG